LFTAHTYNKIRLLVVIALGTVAALPSTPIPAGNTVRVEGGAGLCQKLIVSRTQIVPEILLATLGAKGPSGQEHSASEDI